MNDDQNVVGGMPPAGTDTPAAGMPGGATPTTPEPTMPGADAPMGGVGQMPTPDAASTTPEPTPTPSPMGGEVNPGTGTPGDATGGTV